MKNLSYLHLRSVIPKNFITQLNQLAESTLIDLYNDYFSSNKSFEEFKALHLAHSESVVMRIATLRFVSTEILTKLRDFISPYLYSYLDCDNLNLLLHPLCFLRFNFPGIYYSDKHQLAFLATEPHYDLYELEGFLISALTFWVPLENVNEESGGLCLFPNKEIKEYFTTPNGEVRYDYKTYLELSPEVDTTLRCGTVAPVINAGDVVVFDTKILHGATKSRSKRRVSFDFRLVPITNLKKAPPSVHKMLNEISLHYDIYVAQNLVSLGDFWGASQILQKVSLATGNQDLLGLALALKNRPPAPAILQGKALQTERSALFT